LQASVESLRSPVVNQCTRCADEPWPRWAKRQGYLGVVVVVVVVLLPPAPVVPELHTSTERIAVSASLREVKTLPSPTMTVVLAVGLCSTMVHRLVEVSCTT
jgi:hypothetical protein